MISENMDQFIRNASNDFQVDPNLIKAICLKESSWITWTVRYEPRWTYFYKHELFANSLGITPDTEKMLQSMSWGCMQIMGSVARELGYSGHLTQLCDPELGIYYGTKKLNELFKKYQTKEEVISAYNQGEPKRAGLPGFPFINQSYVDSVCNNIKYYEIENGHTG